MSTSILQELNTGAPFAFGLINLERYISSASEAGNGLIYEDDAVAEFGSYTVPVSAAAFVTSYFDNQPLGTCLIYNSLNGNNAPPHATIVGLDAGAVAVTGPAGSPVNLLETQNNGQVTSIQRHSQPSARHAYLSRGNYTISGAGGRDVGQFSANLTIGSIPTWTNQQGYIVDGAITITRQNGVTLNWAPPRRPHRRGLPTLRSMEPATRTIISPTLPYSPAMRPPRRVPSPFLQQ